MGIAAFIFLFGGAFIIIIGMAGLFTKAILIGGVSLIIGAVIGIHNNSKPFRELLKFLSYIFCLVGFLIFAFNLVGSILLLITGGIIRILAFIIEPLIITFTEKK